MASAATGGGTPTSARCRSTSSGSSPAVSIVWAMASAAPADVLGEREGARAGPVDVGPLQVARQLLDLAVAELRDAPADHQAAAVLLRHAEQDGAVQRVDERRTALAVQLDAEAAGQVGHVESKPSG